MSLIGWALGIQKDSDSPIVMVHCQDLKKVPPPPGAVSWLASLTVAAPAEGAIIAEVDSEHSVGSSVAPSVTSSMDITSAPLISVPIPVESRAVRID